MTARDLQVSAGRERNRDVGRDGTARKSVIKVPLEGLGTHNFLLQLQVRISA
jgi:hypothetical protein